MATVKKMKKAQEGMSLGKQSLREGQVKRVERIDKTNPERAAPISIRGRYGRIHSETKVFENVIHCSDSEENAKKEISLWFKPEEVTE